MLGAECLVFLEVGDVLRLPVEPVTESLTHGMSPNLIKANLRGSSVDNFIRLNSADGITAFPGGEQVIIIAHSGNVLVDNTL